MQRTILILLVIGLIFTAQSASAEWTLRPEVIKVYDGDTFTGRFEIWPNHFVVSAVRVLGVDTPEIRGKCKQEKDLAIKAREYARELLKGDVRVVILGNDKYGGRVDAWVYINGVPLDTLLIEEGLGRLYLGAKRKGWCGG